MTCSVTESVTALGTWVSELRWETVPEPVAERLGTVLLDVLAANAVGARTEGQRALRAAWPAPTGHSPVVGGGALTDPVTAAWLNGPATVCLELDEGNKYAKGHPAAHVFPAVLAMAAENDAAGTDLAAALLAGYEVAARFGRATSLRRGTHPHGNWGVAGAAAGCARLLGLDAERTAAAIDAGSGLPVAGHFAAALDGNPVRDAWVGAANASGIAAARFALAGAARNTGTAARSLGELLGTFAPEELSRELGTRFDITGNYFKRHSSCSYTHPVADLLIDARTALFGAEPDVAEIAAATVGIDVRTHALAAGLDRTTWHNQLSAMFSVPFVAATALLHGEVTPRYTELLPDDAPEIAKVAAAVRMSEAPELTTKLPDNRAARISVRLADGRTHTAETGNPVGDTDFRPFDRDRLAALFTGLLDRTTVRTIGAVVDGMITAPGARALLAPLAA
ncbi:MmgE/PrpD family protein [Nocardia macrotermitis]|uniref:2-methylcitrate dehydratase PrpD n=1 Tax=Nocardia macrotermitis TaxID=2585198 RepID=A0A7K0CU56_9NOCA|nr:MmgE/PrpD family protein [Nocardia macrotermitis]MQY16968.1 hypothetical protein [Nocardia macrotermitis]